MQGTKIWWYGQKKRDGVGGAVTGIIIWNIQLADFSSASIFTECVNCPTTTAVSIII